MTSYLARTSTASEYESIQPFYTDILLLHSPTVDGYLLTTLLTRGIAVLGEQLFVNYLPPLIDSINLRALEEHADATRGMPLHTHRGGAGQAVLLAKWVFRSTCQVFINEALGRQRVFNGHVRDSYAQLSAEVIELRREVEALRKKDPPPAAKKEPVKPKRPRK